MNKASEETFNISKMALLLLFYCISGILLCIALSFLFSILILKETLNMYSVEVLSYIAVFIGSTFSSSLSCIRFGKNFFVAIIQALYTLLTCYFIGALIFSRLLPLKSVVMLFVMCFSGAIFGAVIVALFKSSRRRK